MVYKKKNRVLCLSDVKQAALYFDEVIPLSVSFANVTTEKSVRRGHRENPIISFADGSKVTASLMGFQESAGHPVPPTAHWFLPFLSSNLRSLLQDGFFEPLINQTYDPHNRYFDIYAKLIQELAALFGRESIELTDKHYDLVLGLIYRENPPFGSLFGTRPTGGLFSLKWGSAYEDLCDKPFRQVLRDYLVNHQERALQDFASVYKDAPSVPFLGRSLSTLFSRQRCYFHLAF